jgi:hypothetical protein
VLNAEDDDANALSFEKWSLKFLNSALEERYSQARKPVYVVQARRLVCVFTICAILFFLQWIIKHRDNTADIILISLDLTYFVVMCAILLTPHIEEYYYDFMYLVTAYPFPMAQSR